MTKNKKPAPPVTPEVPKNDATENTLVPQNDSMKRLTVDIPEYLHRAIKSQCALKGEKIADAVREILVQEFTKQ